MVQIPENKNTTIALIDKKFEENQDTSFREHLGASLIGDECSRKLWYSFRWAKLVKHSPRILRLFARGQREEEVFINLLFAANCDVWSVDPASGNQWQIKWFGGHFGGSMDSICKGLVEAPRSPHIAEFKTHNDKSFKSLKKEGVASSKPLHYAQMQVYMHGSNQLGGKQIDRAYYMAVNKNDDELYAERVKYDKHQAEVLLEKAKRIIVSPAPMPRISERPNWYICQMCDYQNICHYNEVAFPTCRSCIHSHADTDMGGWICEEKLKALNYQEQYTGCEKHLFIPELIPHVTLIDSDGRNYAEYKTEDGNAFLNVINDKKLYSKLSFTSSEIHNLDFKLLNDENFLELRTHFNGTVGNRDE